MITRFKLLFILIVIATFMTFIASGCHTANGFGKDMQGAGEDIQKGTK